MKKLTLELEALAVTSFATTAPDAGRGTVRAAEDTATTPPVDDCTCQATCACPSAYFYCNTNPVNTAYSCQYTANASCYYSKACTPA
jgi:hypothetical protein